MKLPFSVEDFLRAVGPTFAMPENARQKRSKPRASHLADCARAAWYNMNDVDSEPSLDGSLDSTLTQEQGRIIEDLVVPVLETLGITVYNRQITLPDDFWASGHPDGEFDFEGRHWGFESKHFGRYQFESIMKRGLMEAAPDIVSQVVTYGMGLGWDAVLLLVTAQDASAVRGDMTINRRVKNPANRWAYDQNPKVQLFALDLVPLYSTLGPMLKQRAEWLSQAESVPAAEYDPTPKGKDQKVAFPCSYCPYRERCLDEGQAGAKAPRLPWVKDVTW
jgi:hypothetical protein